MAPKGSKHKSSNGYKLPEKFPEGTILSTISSKKFRLGKSVGIGGFGEIYLCSDDLSRPVGDDATMAVKIEPHKNGPLFVEMNFYIRAASPEAVSDFMKSRGLTSLGMPCFRGSGSHQMYDEKYRFLIMDRFGNDLQKIFQSGKKLFSLKVTCNLALKILDVLEYIHSKGYVHNDIKAQNLLLGYGRTKENDVYLVDFGLVSKYQRDGVHMEYKPDARKAHDGTIEYTSRDAHIGAHSRRSDLEILGYNLVHWMSGCLPWMDNLANVEYVEAQKKGFMSDIKSFLQRCFGQQDYPDVLLDYLTYTNSLEFDSLPDYDQIRSMFFQALSNEKLPFDGKIDFTAPKQTNKKKRKRKQSGVDETDGRKALKTTTAGQQSTPSSSPSPDFNDYGALTRSSESSEDMDNWSWERVLCSDPEMLIRQASRQSEADEESPLALEHRAREEQRQAESLLNPTPAMLEVLNRMEERERERENMTWQQQLQHLTGRKINPRINSWDLTPNPLTPAMEEVIKMRSKRISVEIDIPITPEPSDSEDSDSDNSSHEEYVPPSSSSGKKRGSDQYNESSGLRIRILPQPMPSPSKDDELSETEPEEASPKTTAFQRRSSDGVGSRREPKSRNLKRRGSVPHVVIVQTLPNSPDRIRNKNSPLKPEYYSNQSGSDETTTEEVPTKRRRISIQNEVAPIKNRELAPTRGRGEAVPSTSQGQKVSKSRSKTAVSLPPIEASQKLPKIRKGNSVAKSKESAKEQNLKPTIPAKRGRGAKKVAGRLASSPQRLSSIPVEVCIETLGSSPAKRKPGRPPKKVRKLSNIREEKVDDIDSEEEIALTVRGKSGEDEIRSTRSGKIRTTRSKDWNWEKVLTSNPDKVVVGGRKK